MNGKQKVLRALAVLAAALPATAQKNEKPQTCGGRIKLENIWLRLAELHDTDGDGKITAEEFTRGDKQFANHDRDGDSVITAADFPAGRFWNGFGPGIARRADRNRDQVVTKAEWGNLKTLLDADGDGEITGAEFGTVFGRRVAEKQNLLALSFDQDGDGKIESADLDSLFADLDRDSNGKLDAAEMRGNRALHASPSGSAPKIGGQAPDFELPSAASPKTLVRLSSFRGKRPVALIFGSYT